MTQKQLEDKVTIKSTSMYGHYKVTIKRYGKYYTCITTNSLAYDTIRFHDPEQGLGLTEKKALLQLYEECKRKNGLTN